MAIYLTAGVSGAHLNLAVTIAPGYLPVSDKRKVVPLLFRCRRLCAAALFTGFITIFCGLRTNLTISSVAALKVSDPQAFSQLYLNPHITLCRPFAAEMVITAILMG